MKDKPILDYGLHPFDARTLTIEEYLQEFGLDDEAMRLAPRCPVCGGELYVMQIHDRAHRKQFVHIAGVHALCPLVNDTLNTTPFVASRNPDLIQEKSQRSEFVSNWRLHLQVMRELVPAISVVRLTRLIEHADVLHLWSCPGLRQEDIPYILLVLAEFIAENPGAQHPAWFRFWFDWSVSEVADLRHPGQRLPQLFRFRYRPSRRSMFPSARHLLEWQQIPMTGDFLSRALPRLLGWEIESFDEFIARERLEDGPLPHILDTNVTKR
jgi:hypothetical protein